MTISESLARKVEADVKGSQEKTMEREVKNALSEIKNKFKYQESYLSTLYDDNFKAYLRSKTFNDSENLNKEIAIINGIKQKLIDKGLESKSAGEVSPNLVTKGIYRTCGISENINSNTKIQNLMKGVIDELMSIPDIVIQIIKNPTEFAKSLRKLIKNPKELINGLKQAYGDAFTQGLNTPEAQYRTGRSSALIVLTFLPGGATKFGIYLAKGGAKATSIQIGKSVAKSAAKSTAKSTAKSVAKSAAKSTARSVATSTAKKVGKNAGKSVSTTIIGQNIS